MFHSLSLPHSTFSPDTSESPLETSTSPHFAVETDALLANLLAHSQRSISCGRFPHNSPFHSCYMHYNAHRKRAVSECPDPRLSSAHKDTPSLKSVPLFPTSLKQHSHSKARTFFSHVVSSDHEPKRHCGRQDNIPNIQLQLQITNSLPSLGYNTEARMHSSHFPPDHHLNSTFVQVYQLEDELGSGGYGFVMTAYHRIEGYEVAVKFIIKDKVPEHAWMDDPVAGRLPTEIVLLRNIHHDRIVKCINVFEDDLYFYLVQELHGSPWHKDHKLDGRPGLCISRPVSSLSTPALSPSSSEASLPASEPGTPLRVFAALQPHISADERDLSPGAIPKLLDSHLSVAQEYTRPQFTRRPSHDLFECIEQSEYKKLTDDQARYVFAQVVDAVYYLHSCGIIHRDIKDENLVIDKNLTVKLIDFGSATAIDPAEPPPYYQMFYGTAAYASSEILLRKSYQAAPAEIWTLGILLSYLLAGVSPFPTARDAVDGRIFLSENVVGKISDEAMDLMRKCLDPNPETRATISQVESHPWLQRRQLFL